MAKLGPHMIVDFWVEARATRPVVGYPVLLNDRTHSLNRDLLTEEVKEFGEAKSLRSQMKELADILYVLFGTALDMGLDGDDLADLLYIVHDANMTKLRAGVQKNDSGKVTKSHTYISPDDKLDLWLEIKREQRDEVLGIGVVTWPVG